MLKVEYPKDDSSIKVFFQNLSVIDLERFCRENGYCVVIQDKDNYYMQKEYGR